MKKAGSSEYTFAVDRDATKKQIAKQIASQFNVNVLGVRTVNLKPATKMQRRVRKSYLVGGVKKAIVLLKKGQKLAIFESEPEKEEVVVTSAENEPRIMKEKKSFLGRTKVRVEKSAVGSSPTTQRKVITGK